MAFSLWVCAHLFKEPSKEEDPNRPFSYRTTWLIFLIGFVVSIGLSMIANIDPLVFAVFLVLTLIFMVGQAKYYGESGAYFANPFSDTGMDPILD